LGQGGGEVDVILLAGFAIDELDFGAETHGASSHITRCARKKKRVRLRDSLKNLVNGQTPVGLSLSPQKTKITTYTKGYSFLGFVLSRRSRHIRKKSLDKFKDKVRDITVRSHNLDLDAVARLNAVIRGVAQYFCAPFATNQETFRDLDSWVRMRLRAMKYKRKRRFDNYKLRNRTFHDVYQLLSMQGLYIASHAS
jgi:hypothetical protein